MGLILFRRSSKLGTLRIGAIRNRYSSMARKAPVRDLRIDAVTHHEGLEIDEQAAMRASSDKAASADELAPARIM